MNAEKHILVISQYFYPEQFRINDICKEWVKRKYKVTVITGIPNYPQGRYFKSYGIWKRRKETYEGIDIVRIPLIPRGSNALMLCLNYLSFVISGFFWQLFTSIVADEVFIYEVSPMTQALPGIWYSIQKKVPCYIYVTDLWPENVEIVTGIHNPFIIKMLQAMVDYIYQNCTDIFTSSKSFIENISKRGVPRSKLHFWPQYAEDFYKPDVPSDVTEIPQDGVFNITFAGNIGYAQGLEILPEAARILKKKKLRVRFNIIGDGRFRNDLIQSIEQKQLCDYFNFIERKMAVEIPKYMKCSDAALICLSKSTVFAMTIPAKTQSCMACGIPILLSADGEVQDIIQESECGFVSDSMDIIGLVRNIEIISRLSKNELQRLSLNALDYYNKKFNKEKLLDEMDLYFRRT